MGSKLQESITRGMVLVVVVGGKENWRAFSRRVRVLSGIQTACQKVKESPPQGFKEDKEVIKLFSVSRYKQNH